mgnify:CR=1 FL=1
MKAGDESGHLLGIVTPILAAGTLVYFNLGAIVLAVIAGVIVLLTVFILLFVRQALIVLLIVVAPLAFVAYLLPNTEPLFQKWRKIFTALLLLFPIIGLLYGGCLLASAILLQVAGDNVVMKIAAYIALVVPLIAVIPLLKGSLNAVPAIGNAIGKLGGKTTGWAQGGAKRSASAYKNSDWNKFRQGMKDERNSRIRAGEYRGMGGNWNPRNWRSKANRAINTNDAYNWATQGFGARRGKSAAKWEGKEITEKAETLAGRLDANGLPIDPRTLFDDALKEHQRVYNDPHASNAARRDARIGLAAAQAHLVRSNGQSGAEYARARLDELRGGRAPASPAPGPVTPTPRNGPRDPHATPTPQSPSPWTPPAPTPGPSTTASAHSADPAGAGVPRAPDEQQPFELTPEERSVDLDWLDNYYKNRTWAAEPRPGTPSHEVWERHFGNKPGNEPDSGGPAGNTDKPT